MSEESPTRHVHRYVHAFDAPADRVWRMVRWDDPTDYLAAGILAACAFEGRSEIGARRRITAPGGATIVEALIEWAPDARYYRSQILDLGPFPVAELDVAVRISARGPQACVFSARRRFVTLSTPAEAVLGLLRAGDDALTSAMAAYLRI